MIKSKYFDIKILLAGLFFLFIPLLISADDGGQKTRFFVDSSYDLEKREEVDATLLRISSKLYFYIDDSWWDSLNNKEKNEAKFSIQSLGKEFEETIYPKLVSTFGSEWKPGIDNDTKTTILIHPMISQAGGYFNDGDEHYSIENPRSNQREMIYFNANHLNNDLAPSLLAHEFTHLITFNQKEKIKGVQEEVWLNEARAEYSSTLVGYDSQGGDSNLNRRIRDFLRDSSNSFIDWNNEKADYGVVNLFTQYLVDQYGIEILVDSLQSSKKGVDSINYALKSNGFKETFEDVFNDWAITVLVNDCDVDEKYCYLNPVLKNFRLIPSINFLPLTGNSSLSLSETTTKWSGKWYKFIGGWGTLKIEFVGNSVADFKVPYVTQDFAGNQSLDFFTMNSYERGEIYIPNFGKNITSLVIMPVIQGEFGEKDNVPYSFFWRASTTEEEGTEDDDSSGNDNIQEVLDKITALETQLDSLKAELQTLLGSQSGSETNYSCLNISSNMTLGTKNEEVRCLQEFLKSQGSDIYPEGLVTGFFGPLTQKAVIRFQDKYASEVLTPIGLPSGTGFVGPMTRNKINQILIGN